MRLSWRVWIWAHIRGPATPIQSMPRAELLSANQWRKLPRGLGCKRLGPFRND
jgi:hypothetical protein